MTALQTALREERDAGWPNGIPVICIEELHNQTKDMLDVKDPDIRRFIDFAMYVSGAQLAHIVFLTSIPVAMKLDKTARFRHKREVLFMDYLSRPRIKEVLAESEISIMDQHKLSRVIGGNLDDLERVLLAMKRGTSCGVAMRHRVEEGIQRIEGILSHQMTLIANATGYQKTEEAMRLVRFWRMLEAVQGSRYVRRKDLEANVFGAYSNEIRQFLEHGILTYAMRVHAGDSSPVEVTSPDSDVALGLSEGLSVSEFDLANSPETPFIARHYTQDGSIDPRWEGSAGVIRTHQDKFAVATTWPTEWIAAGTPRMHVAFDKV